MLIIFSASSEPEVKHSYLEKNSYKDWWFMVNKVPGHKVLKLSYNAGLLRHHLFYGGDFLKECVLYFAKRHFV